MSIKNILVAFLLAVFLLSPSLVLAADQYGLEQAASKAGLASNKLSQLGSPAAVIGEIINIALSFIGVIFFVLIVYAGFVWMTAAGNTESVTKAKNIIEAAIIGLVLVGGAYAIASFVFTQLGAGSGGNNPTADNTPTDQCPAGLTGNHLGCDTCAATLGTGYSCMPAGDCAPSNFDNEGNLLSAQRGLCRTPAQEPSAGDLSVRCCKN